MTWFKVDDSFPSHRKVLAIPRRDRAAAIGLWTLAGGWCALQLTDGHLGTHMVDELASTAKYADLLVRVGLWETTPEGYVFHDWADWQPTGAQVRERRDAEARRKQEWRDRKRARREGDEAVPPGQVPDETRDNNVRPIGGDADVRSTRPDPTRPDPVSPNGETSSGPPTGGRPTRGTRIPEPFAISDEMRAWATEQGWATRWIDSVTERFVDFWRAKAGRDGTKTDWPATWRNWLRREAERGQPVAAGDIPNVRRDIPPWEM